MLRGPLHEKRLKLPVGERPPKPLEWAEGEETQPQDASGNVDGPHAHYNVDLLVVLQRAIQLPWTPLEQELADHAGEEVIREGSAPNAFSNRGVLPADHWW